MQKSFLFLPLCLMALLVAVPSVFAVWDDSTGVKWVSEGETLSLGEHSLKLIDASVDEKVPFIEIKRKGREIYKGFIEEGKPIKVENEIFVEYIGSTHRVNYGAQAKLRVYQWVDAKITNVRFPPYLNREAFYDVWLEVENTGARDAVFSTQLTQEGVYRISSGQYMQPDGSVKPTFLDLAFPTQNVYIPVDTLQRVQYNDIAPNRRQSSLLDDPEVRAGNSIERTATVVYNVYYKNFLLDSVKVPDVGYGKSPSGYIEDVIIPDVMVANEEYEVKALITNGGPGGNNVDTGRLIFQVMNKGFVFGLSSNKLKKTPELMVSEDVLRKGLLTGQRDDWRFTITANVPPGEYDIEFRLSQNRHTYLYSTYDVFHKHVRVIGNANRLIDKVIMPPSVLVGSNIPVEVRLNNVGNGKLLNINVYAPTLLDSPVKRVVTVPTDSSMSLPFSIPALVEGRAPITVEVYQHKASNYKFNDPYSESGALVDSSTKNVEVLNPEEGPSLPPLPMNELPPQPRFGKPLTPSQVTPSPLIPSMMENAIAIGAGGGNAIEGIVPPISSDVEIQGSRPISAESSPESNPGYPSTSPSTTPSPAPSTMSFGADPGIVALVILVLIVILLSLRVVINYHRRSHRMASHAAVEKHLGKR